MCSCRLGGVGQLPEILKGQPCNHGQHHGCHQYPASTEGYPPAESGDGSDDQQWKDQFPHRKPQGRETERLAPVLLEMLAHDRLADMVQQPLTGKAQPQQSHRGHDGMDGQSEDQAGCAEQQYCLSCVGSQRAGVYPGAEAQQQHRRDDGGQGVQGTEAPLAQLEVPHEVGDIEGNHEGLSKAGKEYQAEAEAQGL